ncbi:MAG TPA: HAMP domain-containing histidine kinase [Thiotrichaceae bacterium]|nr:HAMP domain-containing histidine kinase [Thiotrichaceae bacterium]
MSTFVNKITRKRELIILIMMLEMLHLAIWVDFGSIISRSLMLSHLGLFLLWQPVWRGDKKLNLENTILFILFTFTLTIWLNLWLLFAWLILLIGFISGRVTLDRNERTIYTLALGFLVLELLFACVPELADINIEYKQIFYILLTILPLLIFFFPIENSDHHIQMVDFIHAITTSMLTSLVALGSLLNMFINDASYFAALAQTSVAIGGFIICISWLITSQSRFDGVTQLWSGYMLNIGTPLEQWLNELSRLSQKDDDAEEFLKIAIDELLTLTWIKGIEWISKNSEGKSGQNTKHKTSFVAGNLNIDIYTNNNMGGALHVHCNLLIHLIENFYIAKIRQKTLTQQAHLKAIYETGSRITHDIKNLLQSFKAITSIITNDTDDSNVEASKQILKKQLPHLTHRLQLALDKLQTPESQYIEIINIKDWWEGLHKRNTYQNILFQSEIHSNPKIPLELFDSVIDNLLENIQTKQKNEPDIEVIITLACTEDVTSITVCDSGSMIPEHISKELFSNAIKSDNGLGIGLYQANKHAVLFGYDLILAINENGRVCFKLKTKLFK